ncbi:hypothetical protein [Bacillus rubiinfantis]|uniref:hypothetical protein n=1 Tax=Bacillus rubiinfantis TaxID=1499680 RepID=UPI000ACD36D7|nr:hypothetical protein [Bacillus rubiinfantis]
MNNYQKISLLVLFGFPLFFLIVTLITGRWGFFLFSLPPSFIAGTTGYFAAKRSG